MKILRSIALVGLAALIVAPAQAQEAGGKEAKEKPAETDAASAEAADEPADEAEPLAFGTDLEAARREARESDRPLLIVAIPDWYESPLWARVEKDALAAETGAPIADLVRVLVPETRDREVHVRHRVSFEGYPLAVVLGPDGAYLGHTSGLPGDGDVTGWPKRIGAIPARAAKIAALRERLDAAPEDPDVLFDLGRLLAEAGEGDRADALFERMERADPLTPAPRLGEARYLRLRHRVVDLMEARSFGDVENLCLHWRRRFADHDRAADVLLLQANARFLANRHDDAREIWQRLVDEHGDSDAGKAAKKALAGL